MNPVTSSVFHTSVTPDEGEAAHLSAITNGYTVEVRPPYQETLPPTLPNFVQGILELQRKWFGLRNSSPITAFEIRRTNPHHLQFQFTAPTKRMERKIRTHLSNQIPGVEFVDGSDGIPIEPDESIGGGFLTLGRSDFLPIQYSHDAPPNNAVATSLHRHAMQNTKIIIQILFQPVIGEPLRTWWWRKTAYQHRNYLNKEKEKLWGSIKPTSREKKQAREIDDKAGSSRYKTSLRILIIGAEEYTPSRLKEIAGGYNIYEHPGTGQYFDIVTVKKLQRQRILSFANAVAHRTFSGWTQGFHLSSKELAALLSLPDRTQANIIPAKP